MATKAKSAVSDSSKAQVKDKESHLGKDAGKDEGKDAVDAGKPLSITLLHGRGRHLGWVLFGGVGGGTLLLHFGTLGKVIGGLLALIALQQAARAVQTLVRKPGTFRVDGDSVQLPTGLCQGEELKLERAQIDHVFFLRRSVPWTQAGPLLVVEAQGKSYSFPRDWFASDSDQRRVETALNRQLKLDAAA